VHGFPEKPLEAACKLASRKNALRCDALAECGCRNLRTATFNSYSVATLKTLLHEVVEMTSAEVVTCSPNAEKAHVGISTG